MEGKIFLITGGANGLGAATVNAVLNNGAKHVIIFDKHENGDQKNEIHQKYGDNKYYYYNCDVTSEEEVDRVFGQAVEDHDHIDCLVNNAGILNDAIYKQEININYTGLVRMTLKALEHMRSDKGGKGGTIINTSSVGAFEVNPELVILPVYCATKAAVLHFTNCLASKTTWDKTGVRLMTVCYGPTNTPMAYKPIHCVNDYLEEEYSKYRHNYTLQSADVAVLAVVQAYKTGAPGSTWLATDNKPPQDLTDKITEANDIMAACV